MNTDATIQILATAAGTGDTGAAAAFTDAVTEAALDSGRAATGFCGYHPEMGEARPVAQLEMRIGHYGDYYVSTPLELKGRGITIDGWYAAPTGTWPPEGYAPVMTRAEFNARFSLHHLSVKPAADLTEPDDGGLFERTVGAIRRAA